MALMRLPTLSLRAMLVIGFCIGLPLLALPPMSSRIEALFYGPPAELAGPTAIRPLAEVIDEQTVERVSPASYEDLIPAAGPPRRLPHEGLDALAVEPPPLLRPEAFPPMPAGEPVPLNPAAIENANPLLNAEAAKRLAEIRQELENLGAEYILLETTDGGGTYRFHCQMMVSGKTRYTRQFEATDASPLAAGQAVLREVSAWRTAAVPAETVTK
jgi:hypothetical protein